MNRLRRAFDRWVVLGRPMLVRLHPGDVIVITVPGLLGPAEEANLIRHAEDAFGYRNEVLVVDGGACLTVVADMESPAR